MERPSNRHKCHQAFGSQSLKEMKKRTRGRDHQCVLQSETSDKRKLDIAITPATDLGHVSTIPPAMAPKTQSPANMSAYRLPSPIHFSLWTTASLSCSGVDMIICHCRFQVSAHLEAYLPSTHLAEKVVIWNFHSNPSGIHQMATRNAAKCGRYGPFAQRETENRKEKEYE